MSYIIDNTLSNEDILQGNLDLWTPSLDSFLKEFVVQYNFDFYKVANRFHEFISLPLKYDFSEEEIRRHWAFLHSARLRNIQVDEEFYSKQKLQFRSKKEAAKADELTEYFRDKIKEEKEEELVEEQPVREQLIKEETKAEDCIEEEPEIKQKITEETTQPSNRPMEEDLLEQTSQHSAESSLKEDKPEEKPEEKKPSIFDDDDDIDNLFGANEEDLQRRIKEAEQVETVREEKITVPVEQNIEESSENSVEIGKNGPELVEEFINENADLKEEYNNLDKFFNFAVRSVNNFFPSAEKDEGVHQTSKKINDLILESIKEAENKVERLGMEVDQLEKEEEEALIAESPLDEPLNEEKLDRLEAFKKYMFSEKEGDFSRMLLQKISTTIDDANLPEEPVKKEEEKIFYRGVQLDKGKQGESDSVN